MAELLVAASPGPSPAYLEKVLAAVEAEARAAAPPVAAAAAPRAPAHPADPGQRAAQPLIEPLSQRELEVLRLMAQGLSNREIGERLFLALSTVKGHGRNVFDKLHVHRRTEAVARARELGLL
jgi:LuxR family maltose regulon positive regulatory protein